MGTFLWFKYIRSSSSFLLYFLYNIFLYKSVLNAASIWTSISNLWLFYFSMTSGTFFMRSTISMLFAQYITYPYFSGSGQD